MVNTAPACTCSPVPRVATLDGKDGWIHVRRDCPQHGRRRVIPEAAVLDVFTKESD